MPEIGGFPHLRSDLLAQEHISGWFMDSWLFRLKMKLQITSGKGGETCSGDITCSLDNLT